VDMHFLPDAKLLWEASSRKDFKLLRGIPVASQLFWLTHTFGRFHFQTRWNDSRRYPSVPSILWWNNPGKV